MVTVSDIEDKQRTTAEDSGLAGYARDPQGADAPETDDPETNAGTESKNPSSDTTGYTRTRAEQEEEERLAEEASIRRRREKDYASFTNTNQDDNPTGKTGFSLQDEIDDVFKMSWLRYRMHGILKYPEDGRLTAIAGKDGQLTDKQLRVAIIGLVREFGHTKLYAYRGNSIDAQLSQRMQKMLDDLTQPGHILQNYQGKVAVSMTEMEGKEPWRKYNWKSWNIKEGQIIPGILRFDRLLSSGLYELGAKKKKVKKAITNKAGNAAMDMNAKSGNATTGKRGVMERMLGLFASDKAKGEIKSTREERKLGKHFKSKTSGKTLSQHQPVNTYGSLGAQVAHEKQAAKASALEEFNHQNQAPADVPVDPDDLPKNDFQTAASGEQPKTAHHEASAETEQPATSTTAKPVV